MSEFRECRGCGAEYPETAELVVGGFCIPNGCRRAAVVVFGDVATEARTYAQGLVDAGDNVVGEDALRRFATWCDEQGAER